MEKTSTVTITEANHGVKQTEETQARVQVTRDEEHRGAATGIRVYRVTREALAAGIRERD